MQLSPEQLNQVRDWVREGKTLAQVQDLIRGELAVSMTYMEVRFLIDDLELDLVVPEKKGEKEGHISSESGKSDVLDLPESGAVTSRSMGPEEDLPGGGVTVELSLLTKPGALIHGSVTFSDGETSEWQLDQLGRLGLTPSRKGYQPSQEDVQEFQTQLSAMLQQQGM